MQILGASELLNARGGEVAADVHTLAESRSRIRADSAALFLVFDVYPIVRVSKMLSRDLEEKAKVIGNLARKTRSFSAKQLLLARQQKCMALAKTLQRGESNSDGTIARAGLQVAIPSPLQEVIPRASATDGPTKDPRPEPSNLIKSCPSLMRLWENDIIPLEELEKRAQSIELVRTRLSESSFHRRRAEVDPDYWGKFYDAQINW